MDWQKKWRTAGFGGEIVRRFITVDKNIRYQQNLASRNITVLIIRARSGEIDDLLMHVPACTAALETIRPGQIVQIESDR